MKTTTRASLPEVPLPPVFAGTALQQLLHHKLQSQQFAADKAELEQYYQDVGVMQWQQGYEMGEQAAEKSLAQGLAHDYKSGHESGWREAANLNLVNGFNNGFVEASRLLIGGENHLLIDRQDIGNIYRGDTVKDLQATLPQEDDRFLGFLPGRFDQRKLFEGRNNSFIDAESDVLYLNVAKVRQHAQKKEPVLGKTMAFHEGKPAHFRQRNQLLSKIRPLPKMTKTAAS